MYASPDPPPPPAPNFPPSAKGDSSIKFASVSTSSEPTMMTGSEVVFERKASHPDVADDDTIDDSMSTAAKSSKKKKKKIRISRRKR